MEISLNIPSSHSLVSSGIAEGRVFNTAGVDWFPEAPKNFGRSQYSFISASVTAWHGIIQLVHAAGSETRETEPIERRTVD